MDPLYTAVDAPHDFVLVRKPSTLLYASAPTFSLMLLILRFVVCFVELTSLYDFDLVLRIPVLLGACGDSQKSLLLFQASVTVLRIWSQFYASVTVLCICYCLTHLLLSYASVTVLRICYCLLHLLLSYALTFLYASVSVSRLCHDIILRCIIDYRATNL